MRTNIILVSLLTLVGYAYWESNAEKEQLLTLIALQSASNKKSSATITEETRKHIRYNEYRLEVDHKLDYRPIIPVINRIMENFEDVKNLSIQSTLQLNREKQRDNEVQQIIRNFMDSSKLIMAESRALAEFYLTNNSNILGLGDKGVVEYEQVINQLRFGNWSAITADLHLNNSTQNQHLLEMLLTDITVVTNDVVKKLTELTGGRQISCGFGIPLDFYPLLSGSSPGDLVTLIIHCNNLVFNNKQPNAKLNINGKPFDFDYNGIAIYQGQRRPNGKLKIKYSIRDMVDGKEYFNEIDYSLESEYAKPIIR